MADLYPGAQYRPLSGTQTQPKMSGYHRIILHTMVGTLSGTDSYFKDNGFSGTESHFGVGGNGTVYQWQDCVYTADANLEGNATSLSIETEDKGPLFPEWSGSNVPAWTDEEIEAIAQICGWCCDKYGIPAIQLLDSRPERRGIGWHRQGIDNWRVDGGQRWSEATGKVCPGDRRVGQVPLVIARTVEILGGSSTVPVPKPPTTTAPQFPYPPDHYLGQESSDPKCHSGAYAADQAPIGKWQQQMRNRGWTISTDGFYGPQSEDVCRKFQAEKHLLVDGLCGPKTWAASWEAPIT
jgi:N-acetylmuramoyl-L-alanine amidase/Putative peptidoglycan binding domain